MIATSAVLRWGRWAMINIGFGELIDRLERYFGVLATKIAIGIITVCAALVALGFATNQAVYPFFLWAASLTLGDPRLATAREAAGLILTVLWIASVGAMIASLLQMKPYFTKIPDMADEADTLIASARTVTEEAEALYMLVEARAKEMDLPVDDFLEKFRIAHAAALERLMAKASQEEKKT
jgi:hypothetical protein